VYGGCPVHFNFGSIWVKEGGERVKLASQQNTTNHCLFLEKESQTASHESAAYLGRHPIQAS